MLDMVTVLLSNKATDARAAMRSLIEARSLDISENDPTFPAALAKLAWVIADAMSVEHLERAKGDGTKDRK